MELNRSRLSQAEISIFICINLNMKNTDKVRPLKTSMFLNRTVIVSQLFGQDQSQKQPSLNETMTDRKAENLISNKKEKYRKKPSFDTAES